MGRPPRAGHGSLTFAMRRKPSSTSGAQIDADVRPQDKAGPTRRPDVRRRSRLTEGPNAQRCRKPEPRRTIGRGAATIIEPSLHVLDDLPHPIPLAERELDVIETYLGALLDDALGRTE